jgi:hypothetical protein
MTTETTLDVLHLRLSRHVIKRLDHWSVENEMTRQKAVELLLTEALDSRNFHWPPSVR